jgi:hypothetical protein
MVHGFILRVMVLFQGIPRPRTNNPRNDSRVPNVLFLMETMITTMRFALNVGIFSCIFEFENACSYIIMEHGCAIIWTFDGQDFIATKAFSKLLIFFCVLRVAIEFLKYIYIYIYFFPLLLQICTSILII